MRDGLKKALLALLKQAIKIFTRIFSRRHARIISIVLSTMFSLPAICRLYINMKAGLPMFQNLPALYQNFLTFVLSAEGSLMIFLLVFVNCFITILTNLWPLLRKLLQSSRNLASKVVQLLKRIRQHRKATNKRTLSDADFALVCDLIETLKSVNEPDENHSVDLSGDNFQIMIPDEYKLHLMENSAELETNRHE